MKPLFVLLFLSLAISGYSQQFRPEEKLLLSDTLVFLGIDFSMTKMVNPLDFDKSAYIRDTHGPPWGLIDDNWCRHNRLKHDLGKKDMVCLEYLFDSSYTTLGDHWVVFKYDSLTPQQIANHVSTYPHISRYRIGLTFVIEAMDKKKDLLTMYAVYIDLADNTILKIMKCYGTPGGLGYTNYWTNGIEAALGYFIALNHYYLSDLQHFFYKKKKKSEM